jgi:hypothetical protein
LLARTQETGYTERIRKGTEKMQDTHCHRRGLSQG